MSKRIIWLLTAACTISLCGATQTALQQEAPVKVEVRKVDGAYRLFRGGQPYFIRGAGGSSYMSRVAAYGGNSIRTWGTRDGQKVLDSAHKYGLTVLMGLG